MEANSRGVVIVVKILMCASTEQNLEHPSMGSEREILGYCNALAERGHTIYLVNILKETPDWSIDYDLCHMVNAGGYKSPYMFVAQICKIKKIPIFISPVYWPTEEVQKEILNKFKDQNEESIRSKFNVHLNGTRKALHYADMLLPNAEIEMDEVVKLMYADGTKKEQVLYNVIHNGIDVEGEINIALGLKDLKFDDRLEEMLSDRFVLCVGRIEARKNQSVLIEAMKPLWEEDENLQLVLMGNKSLPYIKYIKEEVKGKNILFCPPGPPGAVMKIMRRASVCALVSMIETPGLVNLEAGGLNKPLVVAERGSVKEYLGERDGVFYCEPTDIPSVTEALRGALASGEVESLGEFIRETYDYRKIAKDLEDVYKTLI